VTNPSSQAGPTVPGVSVVVPVLNGARWLEEMVSAVEGQNYAGPLEILIVEDGSTDGSRDLLRALARAGRVRVVDGPRRGATAALNTGIRAATHPLIAQIDQDVVIQKRWLIELVEALEPSEVAAAQGQYVAAHSAGLWSRVMALDLRDRYRSMPSRTVDHVCTGNSVYRKSALLEIGLFDERLGYGYDNDVSYRLIERGYQLVYASRATSAHQWREGIVGYFRQQYGFGYGRLDLVFKHRGRLSGDDVSPLSMIVHAPATFAAFGALAVAAVLWALGGPAKWPAILGGTLLGVLAAERFVAGVRATTRFRDRAGFFFAPAHLVRDAAWAAAILTWSLRRLLGRPLQPFQSMTPRSPQRDASGR
jgi:hypothetical protein